MKSSRRTQPYRKKPGRPLGEAMRAMQAGRTATGFNPMDAQRKLQKRGRLAAAIRRRRT